MERPGQPRANCRPSSIRRSSAWGQVSARVGAGGSVEHARIGIPRAGNDEA